MRRSGSFCRNSTGGGGGGGASLHSGVEPCPSGGAEGRRNRGRRSRRQPHLGMCFGWRSHSNGNRRSRPLAVESLPGSQHLATGLISSVNNVAAKDPRLRRTERFLVECKLHRLTPFHQELGLNRL